MLSRHLRPSGRGRAGEGTLCARRCRPRCGPWGGTPQMRGFRRRHRFTLLHVESLEPRLLMALNPTGLEQELFQLVNRFRTDPQGELTRLVNRLNPISSADRYIMEELQYWKVSGTVLAAQWSALAPVPPLAWSEALVTSARNHNGAMIQYDDQQHQLPGEANPGERMRAAGYDWRRWGENIYAYPRSNLEAHGGFVIDWGDGPYGIQDPPNHRLRLLNASFQQIGIAITYVGSNGSRNVGPLVVTQDLAQPLVAEDAYVVGAVFNQGNGTPWYRNGSGYGGVTVTIEGTGGTFQTTSMSAGGYQLQLPPGVYRGYASGGSLPSLLVSDEFVVGNTNVAIDFHYPGDQAVLPVARDDIVATDLGTSILVNLVSNDTATNATIDAASVVILAEPGHGTLQVHDASRGIYSYQPADGFRGSDRFEYRVGDSRGLLSQPATGRVLVLDLSDHPWHNPWTAADVNGDDLVSPLDALLVIDRLNTHGAITLSVPPTASEIPPLVDVSGDDLLSPRDALLVITQLNALGSGEGEAIAPAPIDHELPWDVATATGFYGAYAGIGPAWSEVTQARSRPAAFWSRDVMVQVADAEASWPETDRPMPGGSAAGVYHLGLAGETRWRTMSWSSESRRLAEEESRHTLFAVWPADVLPEWLDP